MRAVWLGLLSTLVMPAALKPPYAGLPKNAVVLEEESLPDWAHEHRALVLWVVAPSDKPLADRADLDERGEADYTCPDQTRGHFYTAPTRVSLVDTETKRVINTVRVMLGAADQYDIPFWIRTGFPYAVRRPLKNGSGKPHIFALRDFNGDGKALEFAFYFMESCNGPLTMVMGYSELQDRVIVYEFLLREKSSAKPAAAQSWMYRFAAHPPIAPMYWRYTEFYNSGFSETWNFRYVPELERFEGTTLFMDSATTLRNLRKKK